MKVPKIGVKKPVGRPPKTETVKVKPQEIVLPKAAFTDVYLDTKLEAGIASDDTKRIAAAQKTGNRLAEAVFEGRISALHDVRRLLAGEEDALL